MKLVAVLVPLLVAATAHAQAPGETDIAPPGMAAPVPVVVAAPPPQVDVMGNRWAIGLSVGSLGVSPKDQPDNQSHFGIGEVSLRFRATYHLEVELAFGGGREQLQDGTQGPRETSIGMLGLRYRFAADRHWNWWLGGGIGSMSITQYGATDQEKQDAKRPMGSLAIGLEHRWQQFALHAELRGFGAGPTNNQDQVSAGSVMATPGSTTQPPPPTMTTSTDQQSGGIFTIGASYYF